MKNSSHSLYVCLKTCFSNIAYALFGRLAWDLPPWLKRLRQNKHVLRLFQGVLSLLLIASGTYAGFLFWPHTNSLSIQVTPPTSLRDPMFVTLIDSEGNERLHEAAAPVEHFDNSIETGIHLTPPLEGKWQWHGDSFLAFTPSADWPAGQTFQLTFDKAAFDSHLTIKSYKLKFSAPALKIDVEELKLYQDPINPEVLKIIGTLDFNYPVQASSLDKNVHLVMQEIKNGRLDLSAQQIPMRLTLADSLCKAYIVSEPLQLPSSPSFVNLVIREGVMAMKGPSKCKKCMKKLAIPTRDTFFQIHAATADVRKNLEGNLEQILEIETNGGVSSHDLLSCLNVYQLPKDFPTTPFYPIRENYPWSKPGEVNETVLKESLSVPLSLNPNDELFPTHHRFSFKCATPSALFVEISKDLVGAGGFSLGNDFKEVLQTPDCPKEIHFIHHGSLLAKNEAKHVTLGVRGISDVKFTVCRILPQHISHLMTQTSGDFLNPQFHYEGFGPEAIGEIFSEFRQFHLADPCEIGYATVDLAPYLDNAQNQMGLFFIKAESWDGATKLPTGIQNVRLILITDMSLIVKDLAGGTHELFVHSITEGKPVADAEIVLLGKNGLPLITVHTDQEGHAQFPNVWDFKEERTPAIYLVRKGDDFSFIPYARPDRELNYSRFDIGGSSTYEEGLLRAFVFSDRGTYRPGELIHIGAILKNRFAQIPTIGIPLEVILLDPQGTKLFSERMALPETHAIEIEYKLPSHALTGKYSIDISTIPDGKAEDLIGFASFRVEECRPETLKIFTEFANHKAAGWLQPNDLKGIVSLWNLFDLPATNHTIHAKMTLTPTKELHFESLAEYCFAAVSPEPINDFSFTENFPEALTDESGQAEFLIDLQRFTQGTYKLSFAAKGFEAGSGHSVSQEIVTLLTPHPFLIGYRTGETLHFLKQNQKASLNFLAITPDLERLPIEDLTAELCQIHQVSTLIKGPDGIYRYQPEKQRISIEKQPLHLSSEGSDFLLPTAQIGDFALTLCDKQGNVLNDILFSVVGKSLPTTPFTSDLSVKLDKSTYQSGETIEMQITAPYAGTGLLTLERDKIYTFKWFKTDSQHSVQTIVIPDDFQGDGYVNVSFVRAWDSEDLLKNPLSYAAIPFNMSADAQQLPIELHLPETIRSGDRLSIQYRTDQPAKIFLFAVDEGLLQAEDWQAPDPLAYFFRKSALLVRTSQIADLILPKQSGRQQQSTPGGDLNTRRHAMNHSPFQRHLEKPVAFWSGMIDSGQEWQTLDFPIPDHFNGSLQVMAVAASPHQVGSTAQNVIVRSDFIIQPHVPAFLSPNDMLTVTATITNGSSEEDDFTPTRISLATSPHLTLMENPEHSLVIPPGQQRQVSFGIKAGERLGNAQLVFSADQGEKWSQHTATITLRPSCVSQTHLTSGYFQSPSKTIPLKRQFYPEECCSEVLASTQPFILLRGLQDYLAHVAYNTTEQLVSVAFAHLAMAKHPYLAIDLQHTPKKMEETLQLLRERQLSCGGFSEWGEPSAGVSKHSSLLAMDFLTEAKRAGCDVPFDLFAGGMRFLQSCAKEEIFTLDQAREQAYAIYLLTHNGIVTSNELTNLRLYLSNKHENVWRKDLTCALMAASHALLRNQNFANEMIGLYPLKFNDFDNKPLAHHAYYLVLLARHFPDQLNGIMDQSILALAESLSNASLHSQLAALAIQAMSAYSYVKPHRNIQMTEIDIHRSEVPLNSNNSDDPKASFHPEARALRLQNPHQETAFYQIIQRGYDRIPPKFPLKEGLEIYREYRNDKGKAIQSVRLGETFETHIHARMLDDAIDGPIVIVDLLPGGCEVDRQSLYTPSCNATDIREDRILFYYHEMPPTIEIDYKLRAINQGEFTVPPIFAEAMQQPSKRAQGLAGKIKIQ